MTIPMLGVIRADLDRLVEGRGLSAKLMAICFNLGFQAVLLYRIGRWLRAMGLGPLGSFVTYLNSLITGAQISSYADIGKGFLVYHPRGIVVGAKAVIGENCTLVHGNLIGQLYGGGDRAIIGRNFYAATGAKILGRISIGDDVIAGANSVVLRAVPDGVTVSGVPARIIYDRRRTAPERGATTPGDTPDAVVERLVLLLKTTVEGVTKIDAIDESTPLLGAGVGMDSIEVLRLACALEEEFGITVDEGELGARHLRTVGSLASFVARRTAT
jgi:serine O-acetyltransferase